MSWDQWHLSDTNLIKKPLLNLTSFNDRPSHIDTQRSQSKQSLHYFINKGQIICQFWVESEFKQIDLFAFRCLLSAPDTQVWCWKVKLSECLCHAFCQQRVWALKVSNFSSLTHQILMEQSLEFLYKACVMISERVSGTFLTSVTCSWHKEVNQVKLLPF